MRVIVCGGRDFTDRQLCFDSLDRLLSGLENVEIISGHARGADTYGEEYAVFHGLRRKYFVADWKRYGRSAGPIRNQQMLEYAMKDTAMVIAFWDGQSRGTKNMIEQARRARVKVEIVNYREESNVKV